MPGLPHPCSSRQPGSEAMVAPLSAQRFLGKTRMRWKETAITEIELRQKNELSPEERAKRARQLLDEVFAEVTAEKAGADTANR